MAGTTSHTVPTEATEDLRAAIAAAGITEHQELITRILATGVGLGQDGTDRLDLKITTAALEEMRSAFRLFAPYLGVPKITVFGSARTKDHDPLYAQAEQVAATLAQRGWMVVTGAGPGIMQAAAEGAGPAQSIGVSIRLPFEEKPNALVAAEPNHVTMKYFFTRKLMLMKESRGFVCLPGGFGTMDEMFELLTLQQTGKAEPMPIVLLDDVGGSFWTGLERFVRTHLAGGGYIAPDDLDRVLITDSVDDAVAEILGFWHNYDSLRWVGDRLVLRLKHEPTDAEVQGLNDAFGGLLTSGSIDKAGPLAPERADDDKIDLPRVSMDFDPFQVGDLHHVIRAINALPSAA